MFDNFSIGYTDYIRTTEERHKRVVGHIWVSHSLKCWCKGSCTQGPSHIL